MTVLDVYLEAVREPIGQLSSEPDGDMSFRYVTDAIPHAISASLPIREEPFGDVVVRGFFSNLLFENEMRDQVCQVQFKTDPGFAFKIDPPAGLFFSK